MVRVRPAFFAASHIFAASRAVIDMGFSTRTCFPALRASMVGL